MKAVILAAGVGSRLGSPFPKSLAMIPGEERIMGRQIRILKECGINEIITVVGFKMTIIMENFPQAFYKYNPFYYLTNTSKSLMLALRDLDDDVLWVNGDVVFDPEVIRMLVANGGNQVAVDRKNCGEEEVKYTTDENGIITAISKTVANAEGEAVGVNMISRTDLPALVQALDDCKDDDYFEMGLELLLDRGIRFTATDISEYRCIEVDFEEDLIQARKMFAD